MREITSITGLTFHFVPVDDDICVGNIFRPDVSWLGRG